LIRPHLENFGYTHFYVVSPEMRLVAASDNDLPRTFQTGFGRSFVKKAPREGSALSRPHRAAALLPDAEGEVKAGLPTMLAAAVIPTRRASRSPCWPFRLRPGKEFSEILQTARFGESGETWTWRTATPSPGPTTTRATRTSG